MKFDKSKPVKIVMLGAGGTGGHIAPHLYRLLYSLDRPVRFIIADGDVIEPKNLVRQNFIEADLGENKAQVLAERYGRVRLYRRGLCIDREALHLPFGYLGR